MALTTLDVHSALVLVDLQNGIVTAPTTPYAAADVLARSVTLADAFRSRGRLVVLVRATTLADGSDWPQGRTDRPMRLTDRPAGWDLIADDLAGHPEDVLVTKRNAGAFYGTDLDLQLRRRGITQIVLGGISTTMGVESTARAAHEHGYHVSLVTDAMTDLDAESHRHSIEKIFPRLGESGTTADVLALLGRADG